MMTMQPDPKLREFINELSGFAHIAEDTLKKIEENKEKNLDLFSIFSEKMFTIRGTAIQLNLPHIAKIAGLGEEIALKGTSATTRPQIRKCVGSLWDALTTVKFLLENATDQTGEEQEILINRLENTLKAFGGARPTISADELENLLNLKKN
ncbi:MAG: hypothetical protein AB7P04_02555 [Bacteriovoracia bacterium]